MRRFKIIQIYVVPADTKNEAMAKFAGDGAERYFETTIVKEFEEPGFWGAIKKQIAG